MSLYRTSLGALGGSPSLGALAARQGRDPSLVMWLRRGVGMFSDVTATALAVAGDRVAVWCDVVSGIIVSQTTLATRPVVQADGSLAFNGLQRLSRVAPVSTRTGGWTMIAAATTTSANNTQVIANNGQASGYGIAIRTDNGSLGGVATQQSWVRIPVASAINTRYVWAIQREATAWRGFVGSTEYPNIHTTTPSVPVNGFIVGSESLSGQNPFIGTIEHVLLYDRALTLSEVSVVSASLY